MPDAFRKVSPGSSVTAFSITAWNRMLDMLSWWQTQQALTGATLIRGVQQTSIFDIKNASGAAQPWLGILGIDSPLYDPNDDPDGFSARPVLKGVEPTVADHAGGKWAVLLDNVADDDMCRCAGAGVVPTFVYVNSYDDKYCDVIEAQTVGSDTTYLGSGATGAEILWWEATSSDDNDTIVWALVRLGQQAGPLPFELYDDMTPEAPGRYVWLLNPDGSRNTTIGNGTIKVSDSLLGDVRAYGSNHSGLSTGAKGFYQTINTAIDANVIISIQRLTKMMIGSGPGTAVAAGATFAFTPQVACDDGQLPCESGATVSVTNYGMSIPASAANVVVVADGQGGWRVLDADCNTGT